jgi:hypothetical protein
MKHIRKSPCAAHHVGGSALNLSLARRIEHIVTKLS